MLLSIRFDDSLLMRYHARKSPLFFYVSWQHRDLSFPEPDWMDFGVVTLGWWLQALGEFETARSDVALDFMDGPFSLRVRRYEHTDRLICVPTYSDGRTAPCVALGGKQKWATWKTTLTKIRQEILRGAQIIVEHMSALHLTDADVERLHRRTAACQERWGAPPERRQTREGKARPCTGPA